MSYRVLSLLENGTKKLIHNLLLDDINNSTLEDFIEKEIYGRVGKVYRPKHSKGTKAIDIVIEKEDWIPIETEREDIIDRHIVSTTLLSFEGIDTIKITHIVPLARLKDSENSKDMCLALLGEYGDLGEVLVRAIPIAQLCLWAGEKGVANAKYKVTGEKVEFIGYNIINSNKTLVEFMMTNTLFESECGGLVQIPKLLVDRNNTLIGIPLQCTDGSRDMTRTLVLLDFEKIKRVGLFTIRPYPYPYVNVAILNWQHLREYDFLGLSKRKRLIIDLDTTKEGMERQFKLLRDIFYSYVRLAREYRHGNMNWFDVAVDEHDIVNNLQNFKRLVRFIYKHKQDVLDGEYDGFEEGYVELITISLLVLIDNLIPFVGGEIGVLELGDINKYKRLQEYIDSFCRKYGDNPQAYSKELMNYISKYCYLIRGLI